MTKEYRPGEEDLFLTVRPRDDGNVSLGIHLVVNNERIYGVILPPEIAREVAQQLTLASWRAEEGAG